MSEVQSTSGRQVGRRLSRLVAVTGCLAVTLVTAVGGRSPSVASGIDYSRDIRPILADNCFRCHGPDANTRQARLRLDERAAAVERAITPGRAAESLLIARVSSHAASFRMPPEEAGHALTGQEIELLKRWIDDGAEYSPHWSYVTPVQHELPQSALHADWPRRALDHFVLERMLSAGLTPSDEADRRTLIRRVSLDLTGLPPTPEQVASFVHDKGPDAYERVVDRLLESPHFGERWARVWLDLARYADTRGYEKDARRTIWPYRDWVIAALNADMGFDQFTIEQLAGDLLPDPSRDQLIATAFHRNTMTNDEGGTDDEEFRVAAVVDRVNTTMQAWMGLTAGCAQCHTHKYDPLTHTEYYQLFAFFNQTADADRPDEQPVLAVAMESQERRLAELDVEIARVQAEYEADTLEFREALAAWERSVAGNAATWRAIDVKGAEAQSGAQLVRREDGSLRVEGILPQVDRYEVLADVNAGTLTGVRLEVIPDPGAPGPGPGRTTHGNFVLNDFRAAFTPAGESHQGVRGRTVRVRLRGDRRILSVAEIQVFSGFDNVALGADVSQSSTDFGGDASRAVDGNTDGHYSNAMSVTHTRTETDPWLAVNLGREINIDHIVVWNRTDGNLQSRLAGAVVEIVDGRGNVAWSSDPLSSPGDVSTVDVGARQLVVFTRASATHSQDQFHVREAIDGSADPQSGWAVAPQYGMTHEAVFAVSQPFDISGGTFAVSMVQSYGYQHTIARFRLAATSDTEPVTTLPRSIADIVTIDRDTRTDAQRQELAAYFRATAPAFAAARDRLESLRQARAELEAAIPHIPIMRELPSDARRVTRRLEVGSFLSPAEEVAPGVPRFLHEWPADAPLDRLGLARWIVSTENPLSARVVVNRYWEQFFGTGIVDTSEDFGIQGAYPSHPQLLDWLAVDLMDHEWSLEHLCRQIVTSATYRQSSRLDEDRRSIDPRNRLLARGPRFRLEAEMVRDQALSVAGLLSDRVGGPSVFPFQPDRVWETVYSNERWETSSGEDRYRRGLYTFWRRTAPYPSMMTFDASSRETCVARRIRTNTPLQALVTLNDPTFVEAAAALGRRMIDEGGGTDTGRIERGFLLCLARPPDPSETSVLLKLLETERQRFQKGPAEAAAHLGVPEQSGDDLIERASFAVIASVLLNLDEFLNRP